MISESSHKQCDQSELTHVANNTNLTHVANNSLMQSNQTTTPSQKAQSISDATPDQVGKCDQTEQKPRLFAVCGNIGSGKSTFIKNFLKENPEYQEMPECLDTWKPYFKPYYETLDKASKLKPGEELSIEEQSHIVQFQLITSLTRYQQYLQIDPQKYYIFERTVYEAFTCFLPNLRKYITNDALYNTLYDFQFAMCQFEPRFDKTIVLGRDLPLSVLYERIKQRNRPNEKIDLQYLMGLKQYYDTFEQQSFLQSNPKRTFKNQHYVLGSIGVGKTTFLNSLPNCRKQTEEIGYWSYNPNEKPNLLDRHLRNVNSKDELSLEDSTYSFIFQLRVMCSRLLYQQNDMLYERNVIEEYICFMEQYKHVFTLNQYNLLKQYYQILLPHFLNDAIIYFIKPLGGVSQQLQQIQKRNREGEDQYTKEYIIALNKLYDELENEIKKYNIKTMYYIYH